MENISQVVVKPMEQGSEFVVPIVIDYTQDGVKKTWEAVQVGDCVLCIIFNVTRQKLVCVQQFRPGTYINSIPSSHTTGTRERTIDCKVYPPQLGITLEFCGGVVDKPLTLEQIAAEEVSEETGYSVSASSLIKIGTCRSAVGIAGEHQTLYYVEVTDDMRTSPGGGIDCELINVVEFSINEAKELLNCGTTVAPPEFFWGLSWFFLNKV